MSMFSSSWFLGLLLILFPNFAVALLSSGVIVPLYNDPANDCSNWSSLFTAISSHPNVPFLVVLNPSDGPGSSAQPDSQFPSCIAKLIAAGDAQKSVTLVGYVVTDFGKVNSTKVLGDVKKYAGWDAAYRPSGIYFDQTEATSQSESVYRSYAKGTKIAFGQNAYVAFESGVKTSSGFFSFADLVVTASTSYNSFKASQLTLGDPKSPNAKQGVILNSAPAKTPPDLVNDLVKQNGIGRIFISDSKDLSKLPSDIGAFAGFVETAAQVNSTGTPSSTSASSSTSSPEISSPSPPNSGPNVGAIVAGVLAPVLLISILLFFFLRRRNSIRTQQELTEKPTPWIELRDGDSQHASSHGAVGRSPRAQPISASRTPRTGPMSETSSFSSPTVYSDRTQEHGKGGYGQGLVTQPLSEYHVPTNGQPSQSFSALSPASSSERAATEAENERLRWENRILREQTAMLSSSLESGGSPVLGRDDPEGLPAYPGTPPPNQASGSGRVQSGVFERQRQQRSGKR